jgi:hypothetical protein
MTDQIETPDVATPELPEGEYAIVEVLGHRTYIGRVTEVERFGTKLMSIEPVFKGKLLPPVYVGGGSLYQFTPIDKATAQRRAPSEDWQLPASIRATFAQPALPPACDDPGFITEEGNF